MFRSLFTVIILSIIFNSSFAQNSIVVDADKVLNTIPSTMYGSCMEDVNHEIYGGLYDQKIMGESFEEPSSGLNYGEWKKYSGYWAADREYDDNSICIVPGRHTKRMIAKNELGVEEDETAKVIYDPINLTDGIVEADIRFLMTTRVWGMPPFYAQQMAAANHLPLRVQDSTTGSLNVTAPRSEDGKVLVLHVVNTDSSEQPATIFLNNFAKRKKQVQVFALSGALNAENLQGNPEAIGTRKIIIDLPDTGNSTYTFAPLSYTILRFDK